MRLFSQFKVKWDSNLLVCKIEIHHKILGV